MKKLNLILIEHEYGVVGFYEEFPGIVVDCEHKNEIPERLGAMLMAYTKVCIKDEDYTLKEQ